MSAIQKEDYMVLMCNIFHGLYTIQFLGGIPLVLLSTNFFYVRWSSVLLWVAYMTVMYLILQGAWTRRKIDKEMLRTGLLIGGAVTLCKGILDTLLVYVLIPSSHIISFDMESVVYEFSTILTGLIALLLLFFGCAKRKFNNSIKQLWLPVLVIVILVVGYGIYFHIAMSLLNKYAMNDMGIWYDMSFMNVAYYKVAKIMGRVDVLIYVIFYTVFWWLFRRMEKGNPTLEFVDK